MEAAKKLVNTLHEIIIDFVIVFTDVQGVISAAGSKLVRTVQTRIKNVSLPTSTEATPKETLQSRVDALHLSHLQKAYQEADEALDQGYLPKKYALVGLAIIAVCIAIFIRALMIP